MRERLLPPLTLQMLVENAVKHNVISVSRPLFVRITATSDGWLHVVNNLQRKIQQVPRQRPRSGQHHRKVPLC